MDKLKKIVVIVGLTILILFLVIIIIFAIYCIRNTYYYEWGMKKIYAVGFKEKQITTENNTVLNYAEGPDNGPALLLIHGQLGDWTSYMKNLPELSKYYHIFAIDCPGHGNSSHDSSKYSVNAIGADFTWFIENVIGEPTVVSGHSSGGLLAAWLAANSPKDVLGIVLEDPPLFSCEDNRKENTYNYIDLSTTCYEFLNQTVETDFTLWYFENQKMWSFFPNNAKINLCNYAAKYRKSHNNSPLKVMYLPPSIMGAFTSIDNYDPLFGKSFYDGSWMKNFDHAETLSKITCPTILIHASYTYSDDGILQGAMDDNDAELANSLIQNSTLIKVKSQHCVHFLKPKKFNKIMIDFLTSKLTNNIVK